VVQLLVECRKINIILRLTKIVGIRISGKSDWGKIQAKLPEVGLH